MLNYRRPKIFLILLIFILLIYLFHILSNKRDSLAENEVPNTTAISNETPDRKKVIYLTVVACGDRLSDTLNMLKSALMFTVTPLVFLIITEDDLRIAFDEKLQEWQQITKFQYKLLPLTFPKSMEAEWKKLFKPCASQRLFLPSVLPDIDSVIYVDTDTLFLGPVDLVWDHFYKMNATQLAALAPEQEDPNVGWYNRFARHPYYGELGVNSGVMLMNLTRMREFQWDKYVIPIYKKYKLNITWGDQDIINILFHYYPDKLYVYSCRYNYRPDHCMYMSICKSAEKKGVIVLHGSRNFFHSPKQPIFQTIYRTFQEYEMGTDKYSNFRQPLEASISTTADSTCGKVSHIFLTNPKNYIPSDEEN